jgi:hypothetical protein
MFEIVNRLGSKRASEIVLQASVEILIYCEKVKDFHLPIFWMRYDGREAAARIEVPSDLRGLDVKWEGLRLFSEAALLE